jgi:hypothetical protein
VTPGVTPSATSTAYVGIASTPTGQGYWLAEANGTVARFGDAGAFGSLTTVGIRPAAPMVGIAATPDGRGYWLGAADGGVFGFGDAAFAGPPRALSRRERRAPPFGARAGPACGPQRARS